MGRGGKYLNSLLKENCALRPRKPNAPQVKLPTKKQTKDQE